MLCLQLVDKFAPPPLRPQKVDVTKVAFGIIIFGRIGLIDG